MQVHRNPTRSVRIGSVSIGSAHPIAVQSMTATHTQDVDATVAQVNDLVAAGADVVRIAVDSVKDAEALARIRERNQRQPIGRLARELPAGPAGGPARRQDPLQPGTFVPPRAGKALAGQGQVPGRRGGEPTTAPSAWA